MYNLFLVYKSKGHHYIPEFYQKGFLNQNNKFKIYSVQQNRFLKGGKEFSTKSYFFEENANSFITDTGNYDFLETLYYKSLDQKATLLFDKIRNAKKGTNFGVSDSDMPLIQFFIANIFWRIPANYERIRQILNTHEIRELGIKLIDRETKQEIENIDFENLLKKDENSLKLLRFWLPNYTYPRLLKCDTPIHIQEFPKGFPAICSDNPLIFRTVTDSDVYTDDLIFPLTDNLLMIRSKKINNILSTIKVDIDLLLYKQAINYVSCTDERYIDQLESYFAKCYKSTDEIREYIFKELIY